MSSVQAIHGASRSSYVVAWAALFIGGIGSQLTCFCLGLWLFERTGSVSLAGYAAAAASAPLVLATPFAGVLVDRLDRRRGWQAARLGIAVAVGALALAAARPDPAAGPLLGLLAVAAALRAFEFPAFSALAPALAGPEQLGRLNGLPVLGFALTQVLAPGLGSWLLGRVGLPAIALADAAASLLAVALLALPRLPRQAPAAPAAWGAELLAGTRWLAGSATGWKLLGLAAIDNLTHAALMVLLAPLVFAFADASALPLVFGLGGAGIVAGAALLAACGQPRRPFPGIALALAFQAACFGLAAARPGLASFLAAGFGIMAVVPVVEGIAQTTWQLAIPPALQGRVFATRSLVAGLAVPLAAALTGPLADALARGPGGQGQALVTCLLGLAGISFAAACWASAGSADA